MHSNLHIQPENLKGFGALQESRVGRRTDSLTGCGLSAQRQMHDQPGDQTACLHLFVLRAYACQQQGPVAGELPLDLLITSFSFLPDLRPIAVCACVSRHWRRAAAQAVPNAVTIDARIKTELS